MGRRIRVAITGPGLEFVRNVPIPALHGTDRPFLVEADGRVLASELGCTRTDGRAVHVVMTNEIEEAVHLLGGGNPKRRKAG